MRKIMLFAIIIAITVSLSLSMINHAQAQDTSQPEAEQFQVWTVRQGDTLWSIANQHRGRTEVRKYIYQIQKLNDINSTIHPGQKLLLPRGK
jgi:LysM repeat protein